MLKGTLERNQWLYFCFLWERKKEKMSFPWTTWKTIAIPKKLGGWELKNVHIFAKDLAGKNVWRLIEGIGLWCLAIS